MLLALIVGLAVSDYPVKPVPFTSVHLTDTFWAPKIEINRSVTIPFAFQKCEETGRVNLFERAAAALRGEQVDKKPPGYPFDDSDIYKVLEGAAYALQVKKDPKLEAYVDKIIDKIAAAQEADGYLYTTRTISPENPHPWSGKERWVLEEDNSHELYNLGHLFEAAVAHYQATGKKSLLNVATKAADLLVKTFGPGKRKIWPGHQITEMGLAKLFRVTGKKAYIDLAKFLLDCRGGSAEYWQAHKPVVEQDAAVGHAVRATYMYSGMADVAALLGDPSYLTAVDRIWNDVVDTKLYVTGGIGATGAGEAFGKPFQLPNLSAYCETCAAVGNDYWNHRLFLLHKDAKYIDVFERTLYNGLISGVSLDGKSFFYPNPLESVGNHRRSPWFGVACCPGNITRFMASVPGYFYAQDGDTVYVNLYAEGKAELKLGSGTPVEIRQRTNYPWDGKVRMEIDPKASRKFFLKVRVPGWARNEAVPSKLYTFNPKTDSEPAQLKINGKVFTGPIEKGYWTVDRLWKKGDILEADFPMPVERITADPRVGADTGRVAVQRGPIVYCIESPDNPNGVRNLLLPEQAAFQAEYRADFLGGVTVLTGEADALAFSEDGKVVRSPANVTLIPYFAWANRGSSEMAVWIPATESAARPKPFPTLASKSKITTSGGNGPRAINDLVIPLNEEDDSAPFFHWWPKKGTTEWVEMNFQEEATVSETTVFWFDDTGRGECRVPESWELLYRDGDSWKPVKGTSEKGVLKDKSNRFTFEPVKTRQLRLEVKLQPRWATGIYEWEVK